MVRRAPTTPIEPVTLTGSQTILWAALLRRRNARQDRSLHPSQAGLRCGSRVRDRAPHPSPQPPGAAARRGLAVPSVGRYLDLLSDG